MAALWLASTNIGWCECVWGWLEKLPEVRLTRGVYSWIHWHELAREPL